MQPADRARIASQRVASSRLESRLTALSAPVKTAALAQAGGWRALPPGGGIGPLVREVDETILPRRLAFDNGLGDRLALDVSSGRVRSLAGLHLATPGAAASYDGLTGHCFLDAADPVVPRLADLLRHICREGACLRVRSDIAGPARDLDTLGVSLQRLARPSRPIRAQVDLAALADRLEPMSEAQILVTSGTVRRESGERTSIARLRRLATDELAERAGTAPEPQAIAWSGTGPEATGILCLSSDQAMLFSIMAHRHILEALAIWQAQLGMATSP